MTNGKPEQSQRQEVNLYWFDEVFTMSWSHDPRENFQCDESGQRFRDEFHELIVRGMSSRRTNYTSSKPVTMPEFLCSQFIGGPKNAMQEYWPYRKHPEIRDGAEFSLYMKEPLTYMPLSASPLNTQELTTQIYTNQTIRYKAVFIPLYQTPFSDAQIVIAVFQS